MSSSPQGDFGLARIGQIAVPIGDELWMAFFRDPDGNLLALMSEA